ncbi:hypothetical protein [Chryseobacterium profundimaris]|uniref:Uncharacterized protein n=1 Tax=Chryseobacterium profundimaris TaxID=1387275 RepID=A0ABY1PMV9_9FLAO|nr:hypothetical protein [Chryseobacterium profundimaris]SMP35267.1 hypothetical protein SAMN06264346_12023 [Chryseobacterium profundimaris]
MFEIILNHPRIDKKKTLTKFKSVGELIENIFPFSEDYLYVKWRGISIPVSYKYDLSMILEDFVYIVKFLESSENLLSLAFPSNTFDVEWNMRKEYGKIIIQSKWNTVLSHNEKILNENSYLIVDIDTFKSQIFKMLEFIYKIIFYRKDDIDKHLLNEILKNKPNNLII